jgi:hypothetical protein
MRRPKILEIRRLYGLILGVAVTLQPGLSQSVNSLKLLDFKYGFQAPAADLRERFGGHNQLGLGLEWISLESKVFAGLSGFYFFGNNVKEDVIAPLRGFDGNIIGIDGQIGDVNLKERGYYVGLIAGKIIPTTDRKSNLTGIRTHLGLGFLQHKIRVQDNFNTIVPLEKRYLQGYDRLTNGPAIHLGLGFQYDSPINNFHFRIMGELIGARTKSRRDLDYATGGALDMDRTDVMYGLHFAYIVVISRTSAEEHIYY